MTGERRSARVTPRVRRHASGERLFSVEIESA